MSDVVIEAASIKQDARPLKLRDAAVRRAKQIYNIDGTNAVGAKLGFSKMTWYRLRAGTFDIRLSQAYDLADQLGWSITDTFEPVDRAA